MPGSPAAINAVDAHPGSVEPAHQHTGRPGIGKAALAGGVRLPSVPQAHLVPPADARELSKLFFARLRELPEGSTGHQYARNTLIEMNMSLVRFAARGFRSRTGAAAGSGAEMEDVLQAGTIGLIKAIDRFDPDRGVEFSTLALPYVTGEIKRHFRDTTWAVRVPRRLQELRIELAKARDDLSATLGRAPTVKETAHHLRLDEETVIEGLVASNGYSTETLDAPPQAEEQSAPGQRAHAVSETAGENDPALELFEDLHSLGPLVKQLPERDRTILYLRFGQELTQAEIGAELGISQMQVSRLLTSILTRLRAGMLAA